MPDKGIWDQYWRFDRIASCFDGAGATNYDACIADGWRTWFEGLPDGTRILDLCTGNGAIALLAARAGRFEIVAVDQAAIDPPAFVTRHAEEMATIRFVRETDVEALPFPDAGFGAVISQYGIEYSRLERSLPEAVRMLAPGGRLRFVVHASDGVVAGDSARLVAEAVLLLDEIDLPGCATRCFEAVYAVEREGGDKEAADRCFAAFQAALERTARHVPRAQDKTMFRNCGAVLLDTFSRRGAFDLAQLLAKADEVRLEIDCHRGRLSALVAAAIDRGEAERLAEHLRGLGASACESRPLHNEAGLIAYVIEARF
jgi:SAM-dependent methyltransferase